MTFLSVHYEEIFFSGLQVSPEFVRKPASQI